VDDRGIAAGETDGNPLPPQDHDFQADFPSPPGMESPDESRIPVIPGKCAASLPVFRHRQGIGDVTLVDHHIAPHPLLPQLQVEKPPPRKHQQRIETPAEGGSLVVHVRRQRRAECQGRSVESGDTYPHLPRDGNLCMEDFFQVFFRRFDIHGLGKKSILPVFEEFQTVTP